MKTSEMKRTVAGLSVALAMVGGLAFGGASRVEASRAFVICEANFTHLQADPGFSGGTPSGSPLSGIAALPTAGLELPRDPWVDLSVAIVGCNPDGSPDIRISNIGTRDSHRFMVLEQSAAGERETEVPGIAAGQTVQFHDLAFPADCGKPAMLRVDVKHEAADSNYANNNLPFTPSCGSVNTGPIG